MPRVCFQGISEATASCVFLTLQSISAENHNKKWLGLEEFWVLPGNIWLTERKLLNKVLEQEKLQSHQITLFSYFLKLWNILCNLVTKVKALSSFLSAEIEILTKFQKKRNYFLISPSHSCIYTLDLGETLLHNSLVNVYLR